MEEVKGRQEGKGVVREGEASKRGKGTRKEASLKVREVDAGDSRGAWEFKVVRELK